MAKFIAKVGEQIRVLLDGGGERKIDGIKKKVPARWADFTKTGSVKVFRKEDIETLKRSKSYGKKFTLAPEEIKVKEKVKVGATVGTKVA